MTTNNRARRWATAGTGLALALSLAACGGNVGGGSATEGEEFPGDDPITVLVGQDPGGSTDLIARALADEVSDDLGVPVTVAASRSPWRTGPAPTARSPPRSSPERSPTATP
jgi:hypothetical protein